MNAGQPSFSHLDNWVMIAPKGPSLPEKPLGTQSLLRDHFLFRGSVMIADEEGVWAELELILGG